MPHGGCAVGSQQRDSRRQRDTADLDLALVERRGYLCIKGHGSSSTISKPYDGGSARPFARSWQLPITRM
jgi:hypothetical protein